MYEVGPGLQIINGIGVGLLGIFLLFRGIKKKKWGDIVGGVLFLLYSLIYVVRLF